jgi:rod shape-determining protein MreC
MTTISFRKTASLATVFIVISLMLVVMDRRDMLTPLREGLSSVVSPVAEGFARVAHGPDFRTDLEKQLDRKQNEVDALTAENANLKAQLAEYETLDAEVQAEARRPDLNFVPATVIGHDPTNTQEFVLINKGSVDGIEVGMAVTDPNYYVGQVVEVTEHTAKVMFIVDTSARVGAQLLDSKADGIVVGQWQAGGRLLMQNVDRDAKVKKDEVVITSGVLATETRGVPPNIIIGTVFGEPIVSERTNEVSWEVRPAVDFDSLRTVWVVMPNDDEGKK